MTTPARKSVKPVAAADDFVIDDGSTAIEGVTDESSAPVGSQLPAIPEDARALPAQYSDNFDESMEPAWVSAPALTLVHGVGEYMKNHSPGLLVLGNLERAVELTKLPLNRCKNPAQARSEGRVKVLIVGVSAPVYCPDVKPEHPAFKLEVPVGNKITEGPDAGRFEYEVALRAYRGTSDRKEAKMKGLQLFLPKSEVTLIVEKPDHIADDMADFFPYELDGKRYALAKHFAKKTGFTHFVEKARSLRQSNPRMLVKDGTRFKPGRWYAAPFLLGVDLVQPENSSNSFFVPDLVNCPDIIGPELEAFAASADPVTRTA